MDLFWLAGIALLLLLLGGAYIGSRRPYKLRGVSDARLQSMLGELLERGYEGGVCVIEVAGTDRFLQFKKYIDSTRGAGIQLWFPLASWSKGIFDQVIDEIRSLNHEISFMKGHSEVERFAIVDFYRNVPVAHRTGMHIMHAVFGVEDERIDAYLANVSPRVERIGF